MDIKALKKIHEVRLLHVRSAERAAEYARREFQLAHEYMTQTLRMAKHVDILCKMEIDKVKQSLFAEPHSVADIGFLGARKDELENERKASAERVQQAFQMRQLAQQKKTQAVQLLLKANRNADKIQECCSRAKLQSQVEKESIEEMELEDFSIRSALAIRS